MQTNFDRQFWNERYATGTTGWDAGNITTPLKAYFDQLEDRNLKILIPGAGNAHEAAYLWNLGFANVHLLDIAEWPVNRFRQNHPNFPKSQIHLKDFWLHVGAYDLIVEQTFFCAIDPVLRSQYVTKMCDLLRPTGYLLGLLWSVPMNPDHPPFGGSREEYLGLFKPFFEIEIMENAYNSITPRAGRELFVKMKKI